jgi:class 3 adenylate cyclase
VSWRGLRGRAGSYIVVFADVSGFTRLSERLARRGEEGAEQLVDLINACFTALLAEAYGCGGSLVKFGGDAMVLLFYDQRGDERHAVRACCAAAAMRRRLAHAQARHGGLGSGGTGCVTFVWLATSLVGNE